MYYAYPPAHLRNLSEVNPTIVFDSACFTNGPQMTSEYACLFLTLPEDIFFST